MQTSSRAAVDLPTLSRSSDGSSGERFLEVVGHRAALLGDELGRFEAWIWPLKVLRRLEPRFALAGQQERALAEVCSGVEVSPHEVVLRYRGEGWRAALTLFAAPVERALVGLLEVDSTQLLRVGIDLEPELRPMWPAGMGGQIARTDPETGAFLLTEELGRFAVLCGCPEAEPLRAAGDHALPRDPERLEIGVAPQRTRRGPVVFVVCGAEIEPPPLPEAARRGELGAARGESRSAPVLDRVRALYRATLVDWPGWREQLRRRWSGFLARTAQLESDDERLDEAFLWARIAIERSWVEVDGLGRGLVAGLGRSAGGERPGFGWFFDGDAMVAARALTGCGDFDGAREVLRFAARHQREDGKLMHELVLSARLCNWVEDYPYAYYKAGNTPAFLAVLAHYVAGSGDLELARELWPNALAAFEHCLSALDAEGLFSVRKAGLAAVEAGGLVGRLSSEVYIQGIWASAARGLRELAGLLGEGEVEARARAAAERAEQAFELFWSPEHGRYGFARRVDGGLDPALSAYLALPLGRGLGQAERALASAQALNRPVLTTEWGARMFATDAQVYDPADYNTGSVFPYLANHVILAQYRHGLASGAWQVLVGQLALHGSSGLGFVPEHLYGDRCEEPARGVPHQIFSSATILQSVLYGLLGLDGHAVEGVLTVRSALPAHLDRLELTGFWLGERVLDLALRRERGQGRTTLVLQAHLRQGPALQLRFQPLLPALSRAVQQASGEDEPWRGVSVVSRGGACLPQGPAVELTGTTRVRIRAEQGPDPCLDTALRLERGQPPRAVRLAGVHCDGQSLRWTFWGPQGTRAQVPVRCDRALGVRGAERDERGTLALAFPPSDEQPFSAVQVDLEGLR